LKIVLPIKVVQMSPTEFYRRKNCLYVSYAGLTCYCLVNIPAMYNEISEQIHSHSRV